ncbi:MAG: hypothetical protein OEZ23_03520 [Gammaproteobacteria bacterium]|nr:hypothetical protein [Gammaproteobacteria bacterium]
MSDCKIKPSLILIARGGVSFTLFALILISLSTTIQAEDSSSEGTRGIETVTVTAQRTEESLQDVPLAVTAFTGDMMEDKQIITPSDLQMNAPNVSFTSTNFGGSSFSIR